MQKNIDLKQIMKLFGTIMDLFERFVDKVREDILDPFLDGREEQAQENMHKLSESLTIDKLLNLITKTFDSLVSLKISMDKNYGNQFKDSFDLEEASHELDEKLKTLLQLQPPIK